MRHLLIAISIIIFVPLSFAEEKVDIGKAVEQAEIVAKAVLDGDFAKVADRTHPKVVEILGGRDKMIEQTATVMKSLKDMGITIKSHKLGKVGAPVVDGRTVYLVIPTTLELKADGSRITTESYLLGMTTDGGKNWVFVDGAGMDEKKIKDEVFPKLPEGLKLPEKKPPVISKE